MQSTSAPKQTASSPAVPSSTDPKNITLTEADALPLSFGLTEADVRKVVGEAIAPLVQLVDLLKTVPQPVAATPGTSLGAQQRILGSTSVKPIVLEDEHRRAIERLIGGDTLNTARDVVAAIVKLTGFKVKGFAREIELPYDYLARIESRVPIDTDMGEWIQDEFLRFCELLVDGAL